MVHAAADTQGPAESESKIRCKGGRWGERCEGSICHDQHRLSYFYDEVVLKRSLNLRYTLIRALTLKISTI
jgi:hypothetical protein